MSKENGEPIANTLLKINNKKMNELINKIINEEFSIITPTAGIMKGREIVAGTISKAHLKNVILRALKELK